MLQVKNVDYSYNDKFKLNHISFEITKGEVLGVIGESGCGKSTLLKLIYGELDTHSGDVLWDNKRILGPSEKLVTEKEHVKYVTQEAELMPFISVLENIIKPLSRQYMQDNINRARQLLEVIGLEKFENTKVKHLSGGQKQRVAIAKALAKTPELLLLDEPFSHIDHYQKNTLRRKLFKYCNAENISCVIATHDKNDILPFSDKILVLKNGKIEAFTTPEKLYHNVSESYAVGLLSEYNNIPANYIDKCFYKAESLIIYPHEIKLMPSKNANIIINDMYFHGEYYMVYFNWNTIECCCKSKTKLDLNLNYNLVFNVELISKRLNNS